MNKNKLNYKQTLLLLSFNYIWVDRDHKNLNSVSVLNVKGN